MKVALGSNLARLRKQNGLTQKDVSERLAECGIHASQQTVGHWENEVTHPSVTQLFALCDIYGVDDIRLEFTGLNQGLYSGLNQKGQTKAREFIDVLLQVEQYRDEPQIEVIKPNLYKLFDVPVSAGTGNFLEESSYEMIEAPTYVPAAADFALRVSGDSMKPHIMDGQVIWVKETSMLNSGEIGIFLYSGEVYCKMLVLSDGKAVLVSLNPDYEDIEIREGFEFRAIGKVIG